MCKYIYLYLVFATVAADQVTYYQEDVTSNCLPQEHRNYMCSNSNANHVGSSSKVQNYKRFWNAHKKMIIIILVPFLSATLSTSMSATMSTSMSATMSTSMSYQSWLDWIRVKNSKTIPGWDSQPLPLLCQKLL